MLNFTVLEPIGSLSYPRNPVPVNGIFQIFHPISNLFIYQARESSLVPAGFLTA